MVNANVSHLPKNKLKRCKEREGASVAMKQVFYAHHINIETEMLQSIIMAAIPTPLTPKEAEEALRVKREADARL